MNFTHRFTGRELMDDHTLDVASLEKVLLDINRVNKLLHGTAITLNAIRKLIREYPKSAYSIMDIGCGDGQMLREVARFYKDTGIGLVLIGVDLNEKSLEIAKRNSLDYPNISYINQDVLLMKEEEMQADIVLCTLTMHHFNNQEIPIFLKKTLGLARVGVVINDLQRSRIAYQLFRLYSVIFMTTEIAKHDGLVSIKSAFTRSELRKYARQLPTAQHNLSWKWAFRYLWVIRLKRE